VQIRKHRLQAGDVLLLEGGSKDDVGRGWVWSGEIDLCLHQNHLHRARPRAGVIHSRFLAYSVCNAAARSYCLGHAKQTSNLATINRTQISGLPVRVPALEEQARVIALLDPLRASHDAAIEALRRLRILADAVADALLTGPTPGLAHDAVVGRSPENAFAAV
jgi:type I restriction enzyme, S subunit